MGRIDAMDAGFGSTANLVALPMSDATRMKYFRIALVAIGLFATFGLYPITRLWPSGFAWHSSGRSEYLEMIVAIYATLGVFLVLAARNPEEHHSLISFTIWSSLAHGGVMAVQALQHTHHRAHLWGDVPVLFAVAGVLAVLRPRRARG